MKVILLKDYTTLGEEGDAITVKDGFARNYLFPQKIAVVDNAHHREIFSQKRKAIEKRKQEKRELAKDLFTKISELNLEISMKAGEKGKLFGSVTNAMIANSLEEKGIILDRHTIEVPPHLVRTVGDYVIKIKLYDKMANLKLKVVSVDDNKEEIPTEKTTENVLEEKNEEIQNSNENTADN